jgi:alpha-beta hydrolase superfamily lysophospholipase
VIPPQRFALLRAPAKPGLAWRGLRGLLVMVASVLACAHAPDLPLRPDPAPPAGSTTETFVARDGTQLLARHWPAQGDTRAIVVIMHGLKDYSARYAHFADTLTAAGYGVYAFDLRGHGRSAGPRVAPNDWLDYVDDLDRFLTRVEQAEPGKHVYLFGHSMGGAIAALTAERHAPRLAGLVLSGPALVASVPPLQIAGAMLFDVLNPRAPALALDNHDFSSDPGNAAVMDRDELISQPSAPTHTAAGLLRGMGAIWHGVDALTMPLLALHGSADKLTAPWGSRELVAVAQASDKTLKIYDGANHDLLHEPGGRGAQVEADILAWLDAHEGKPDVAVPFVAAAPYTGPLSGTPKGWTQAVELAGGIGENSTFAGRLAAELARPEPIGWHGALIVSRLDGVTEVALQPIGVAVRTAGIEVGVAGGGALIDAGSAAFALSAGFWAELAGLGAVHVGVLYDLEHPLGSGPDITYQTASGSLRLGRDHVYWPGAHAGVGPVLTGGYVEANSTFDWFVMIGVELYGRD